MFHCWRHTCGAAAGTRAGGRVGGLKGGPSKELFTTQKVFSCLYKYSSSLLLLLVHTKPSGTLDEGSVQLHVQHIGTSLVNSVKLCVC